MATQQQVSIRRLTNPTLQEHQRVLAILLGAFAGDVEIAAMTGGKASLEPAFFRLQFELSLTYGEVYVAGTGGSIDAVALIFAPGQDFVVDENTNFQPSHDFVSKLTPEMQQWWIMHLRPKFAELTNISLGSAEARKAAYYIRIIAAHPEKQRRGLARKLMETFMQKADGGKKKMCLETSTDAMVRVFYKFGFKVRGTKNFGSALGGFPLFCMVREPRPALAVAN
ncbi:hypothetical protein SCHPADRAFT_908364 [Schizopora paradoxa]|uniref:N-acetyltransferase domain-containing protein n=1 Tax=Schizopora paradoxa TaxID=27342 RepID=A0A0H2RAC1_9AGAM|nr:hypothetical protein SCHPADRAFT_908364 [Schizopora paradoxa]